MQSREHAPSTDEIARVIGAGAEGPKDHRLGLRHIPFVSAILLLVGWAVWQFSGSATARPQYLTTPVQRQLLEIRVSATGHLEPTDEVEVSSELSGIIREVLVDENDSVKAGQSLARLDTEKLEAEIAQARAALARARASVRQARSTLEDAERERTRALELFKSRSNTARDVEQAESASTRAQAGLKMAEADVAVATATLEARETDLEKACICSPIDGVVLTRNIDTGQTVASSFQAPVLFTVAEPLNQMELQVDIDEADVSLVKPGQEARFTVDAYPHRSFAARLTKLRLAPETIEGVVSYKAQLRVDNQELLLRPGMTASAEILVSRTPNALVIPNQSLRFQPLTEAETQSSGPEGSLLDRMLPRPPRSESHGTDERTQVTDEQTRVWVLDPSDSARAVPVTVGLSDGERTEVVGGELAEGQLVIVDERAAESE